jgi:signal transduction histidine kinase
VLRQAREPFFTTKTQGTGLGLSVSAQLIEGMGGRLEIESQLDFGTTVTILLPRSDGRALNSPSATGTAVPVAPLPT